jgi:NADPH2:quinone reductase
MQAQGHHVVLDEHGETPMEAVTQHMHLRPQSFPDPQRLGARDVVIAVQSAAAGWVDLIMSSGQYQHMVKPPYTPGLEYAGVIAWKGAEVTHVSVGDRVLADGFVTGPRSLGPYRDQGGFATWAVAPAEAALPLPDALSFDQGCNLLGNYETAYHCLITCGRLQAGETVLIHGASGATGLAAVHIAKLLGATVIATGRSPDKLALVAAQGADHTVCTADEAGGLRPFRGDIKALTGGRGVDVVYDGVGGPISVESLRCVDFGARYLIVGWAATPFVARGKGRRGAPNANQLPTNLIMMKGLEVRGCPTVISTHRDPSIRAPRLAQIMDWARRGELQPVVSSTFALADFRTAMTAKWNSRAVGGICVHPGAASHGETTPVGQ